MTFIKNSKNNYKWTFENVGSATRVRISTGEDIAHLSELDPKMWTVLSCPIKGLELSEKSLSYMDCDADGRLRVNDVICVSKWVTEALVNKELIVAGSDSININEFNKENEVGRKLYNASRKILDNLGKGTNVISLADTADIAAVFAKTRFNGDGVITENSSDEADDKAAIAAAVAVTGGTQDRSGDMGVNAAQIEEFYKAVADYLSWRAAEVPAPFGDRTDEAIAAYNALDAKIKDFFMRSKLASFSPESMAALDVKTSLIEGISAENLSDKKDEISAYPIVRVTGKPEMDLTAAVNPAWADTFNTLKSIAIPSGKKTLSEEEWKEIGAQFAQYCAWKAAKPSGTVEALGLDTVNEIASKDRKEALLELVAQDSALAEEAANIDLVDKFLHIYRDFFRLVRNFVTLHDFYSKDRSVKAIFQSGRLLIDQKECSFCMNVLDAAKHNATAGLSGMYLIYCDCTTKTRPGKLQIVATMTTGEVADIFVGKNAVYYDNSGLEWDAVITKIIDNPISIGQSFWSPYRRMATVVENLISKKAAEKDAKMMQNATDKINAMPDKLPEAKPADPAAAPAPEAAPAAKPPFDIGKFAGIFAAIGMALGMIGTALASLAKGIFALKWWQVILAFAGLLLLISGPAMVLAWLKLRRRNIAPLLNANGWAVNASSKISIPFGETLTSAASFPKVKIKDPYARKGLSPVKKALISLSCIAVVFVALWLCNLLAWAKLPSPLSCFKAKKAGTEMVQQADSLAQQTDSLVLQNVEDINK